MTTPVLKIRFRDTVAAEITKILTHPATTVALALTISANTILAVLDATDTVRLGVGAHPTRLSDLPGVTFAPVYAFLVIPVWAAGSEYQDGQIRTTLTAVPHRATLATSKLAAMLAVTIPAAFLALLPGQLIADLGGRAVVELPLDLARWVAVYALMSAIAFGFAGVARSVVAPISVLVLTPVLIATGVFQWPAGIRLLPDQAGLSLLGTPGYDVTEIPPMTAALVLLAWTLVLNVAYLTTLLRRDG